MSIARNITWALAIGFSMGSAFAASTTGSFVSGTGTLDFMNNEFRTQGLLGISTTYQLPDGNPLPVNAVQYNRPTRLATLTFDSGAISATDGKVSFSAGNAQLSLVTARAQEDEYGNPYDDLPPRINLVTFRNITFDLSDVSIRADITSYTGTANGLQLVDSFGKITVFKGIAPIIDGTQGLVVDGQASGSTVGGLRLTDEGADIVLNGLYAWDGELLDKDLPYSIYAFGKASSWGTASAFGTFTSSVPETSTQWMMFTGLLALFAFSRRSH
ncbi:MAG: hypothetical protein EOP36_15170 [Rubrivivax sp.]|nr:MAG: hypothetical protein EOP36_15170 [Rubrivivax sp.]